MFYLNLLILCVLAIFSSSCTSWKPHYAFCSKTDWQQLGIEDGKKDSSMGSSFSLYQKQCQHFDDEKIGPNLTMYRFGHQLGVKEYCTYGKGFANGMNRTTTSVNCDKIKHKEYHRGVQAGVDKYCRYETGLKNGEKGVSYEVVCSKDKHQAFYKGLRKGHRTYCTREAGKQMGLNGREYTGVCKGNGEKEFLIGHKLGKNRSEIRSLREKLTQARIDNARLEQEVVDLKQSNRSLRREVDEVRSLNSDLEGRNQVLEQDLRDLRGTLRATGRPRKPRISI